MRDEIAQLGLGLQMFALEVDVELSSAGITQVGDVASLGAIPAICTGRTLSAFCSR